MSLPLPSGHSPGWLHVRWDSEHYDNFSLNIRVVAGMMPDSNAARHVVIGEFLDLLRWVFPPFWWHANIFGAFQDENHAQIGLSWPLTPPTGGLAPSADMPYSYATVLTLRGWGIPSPLGVARGPARAFLHVADAWQLLPGVRLVPIASWVRVQNVATWLAESSVVWADRYGQKADMSNWMLQSVNAFYQAGKPLGGGD